MLRNILLVMVPLEVVLFAPVLAGGATTSPRETFSPPAPSFDCKHATFASERAICAEEGLARLDQGLNLAFLKKWDVLSEEERGKLYSDEVTWVRSRNETCTMRDHFALRRCVVEMTIARIAEIAAFKASAK